ncbi:MAG: glycosyltransferase family 2 protein [Candidatus Omnitrophota bacterium]|nr:glycosyltransferase family 2 protein [Candidatus Omnitrophota bacterium]MDZ4243367.1 glycosyltransferase family 2 protein [Candidatus Omnitrophota bacterium]
MTTPASQPNHRPDAAPAETQAESCAYGVVLPVYNEEACLRDIVQRVETALKTLGKDYEIILVDDGSSDNTWPIIEHLHTGNQRVKGIRFLRNFGHQTAIFAGLSKCRSRYIAVMDADGQDPPEILPELFKTCAQGYDVVYAVRKNRKEGFLKRFAYRLFYRCFQRIVSFQVPLDSGDFSVFTREVAQFIRALPEKNPFIRGLRSWYGGKQIGVAFERQKRIAGKPKYGFLKLFHLAVTASISFSKFPLKLISGTGICLSLASFLTGLLILAYKILNGIAPWGWTSTTILIIFFGGLNLFVLGIIGEYIGAIYDEVKNRPNYLIGKSIGFDA